MRSVHVVAAGLSLLIGVAIPLVASQGRAPSEPVSPSAEGRKESPLACNLSALTPEERTRHFQELSPKLRSLKTGVRELADGYEFTFPSDRATYRLLTEWAAGERVCCPFFDVEIRSAREDGPIFLRLSGREGVKKFIEVDGASWLNQ